MKKTIIRLLCAVLVLCMCMAVTPMRAEAYTRMTIKLNADYEQTRLASYEQFLAYYYLTFSSLDFFLKNDQLPFQCYVELADDSFRTELKAWRRLTMNVGEQVTYSVAEVEFYEFLIFDILYQEVYEDELLNNVKTGVDVLELSILEKLHKAGKTWTRNTKITSENAEQLLEDMLSLDDLEFFAKWADIIEKGIEITHTVEQLIEKLYMLAKLNECSEEVCAILNDLYENATNDLMREACRRMTLVATGLLNEAEIMAIFSGEVALSEIVEYGMDKLWEGLLTTTSFGQGLAVGQGVGKLACNLMWSTDAVVENWYSMEKVHIFEQVLKNRVIAYRGQFENNPSLDNAKMFVKAADMYLNTLSVGMEYGIRFFEAVRGGGFFGWLYKNFTHEDDYESVLTELQMIKNSIDLAINLSNNNTYNFYLEELAASGAEETDWEETSCETNQEEVQNTLSALPEILFRLTNQTVSGDSTVTESQTTYGDYSFCDGTLDLAGHTLTVYGDFHLNGTLNVNGGMLDIRGDLHVTRGTLHLNGGTVKVGGDAIFANINSDGSYGPTAYPYSAKLTMDQDADRFVIAGSLITYFDNRGSDNSGMYCSAGEMQIGDDWINYDLDNGIPSGTFRMIFTGTNALTINGVSKIHVPTLVIENAGQRSITMQGNVSAGTLEGGDMTITAKNAPTLTFGTTTGKLDIRGYATLSVSAAAGGDITFSEGAELSGLVLCGHSIQVNGDLRIRDNVSLGHLSTETVGSLIVAGDLNVTCGNLKLNGGTVKVGGDAIFANINSDGSYGPTAYPSSTKLTMDQDADLFAVAGSLITYFDNSNGINSGMYCSAGEMQIGDDWINYDLDNGSPSGTFRMIFNGTNALTINGVSKIHVPTMVIENAGQRSITMQGNISADALEGSDMTITAKNSPTLSFATTNGDIGVTGSLALAVTTKAGGDITVDGDLYSNKIAMGVNTLTINGNLRMESNNALATGPSGKLIVNGDVWMRRGVLTLPGLTEISGSLFQAGGDVKPNKGQVSIRGDYRIQVWDDSSGEVEWKQSSGKLYMTDENDSIVVWGDFYTQSDQSHSSLLSAGCLAVHGDFYQLSGNEYNFAARGTHKVFLCGEAHQSARFASGSSMFNILQLNKQKEDYTFNPDPCWKTLEEGVGTPEVPTSGSCGKNLTWSFDRESGTLTISGEGEMDEYEFHSLAPDKNVLAPWTAWAEDIRYVVIEDGVTSIGSFGFMRTGMVSVTMADSVVSIGKCAFWQCDKLTKIRLSESLHILGEGALSCCSQLAEIVIPAGVTHIGDAAFESCSGLTRITFRGDAPEFAEELNNKTVFAGVDATAYYPAGNETWTADVMQNYGGRITWVPYEAACEHVAEVRDAVEATCTEPGYTGDSYCTVCGEMIEAGTEIPAPGHSFTDYISDGNATCMADGTKTALCERCDVTDTVIDEGSKNGHHHESAVTKPTCTERGYTVYTCACGDQYVADYVDALGHDYTDWKVVQEPTTDGDGLEIRTCVRCGHEERRPLSKQENPFTDVSADSFYYEPVRWAVENGITNGTSATTFGPNDQCMRAHVVTFLWRAVGCPEPAETDNPFVDVKPTDFYYKAVMWALENGITSGMDATHYGPFAYCNRAQVVTFLWRAMGCPEPGATTNTFTDVAPGAFYEKAVLWAVENGITNGLSTAAFGPTTICNRAQIVTFLYRAYN